jgi:hypothetical protein
LLPCFIFIHSYTTVSLSVSLHSDLQSNLKHVPTKTTGIHALCVGDIAKQFLNDVVAAGLVAAGRDGEASTAAIIEENYENNTLFDMAKVIPGLIEFFAKAIEQLKVSEASPLAAYADLLEPQQDDDSFEDATEIADDTSAHRSTYSRKRQMISPQSSVNSAPARKIPNLRKFSPAGLSPGMRARANKVGDTRNGLWSTEQDTAILKLAAEQWGSGNQRIPWMDLYTEIYNGLFDLFDTVQIKVSYVVMVNGVTTHRKWAIALLISSYFNFCNQFERTAIALCATSSGGNLVTWMVPSDELMCIVHLLFEVSFPSQETNIRSLMVNVEVRLLSNIKSITRNFLVLQTVV